MDASNSTTNLLGGSCTHHVFVSSLHLLGCHPQHEFAVHHTDTLLEFFAWEGRIDGERGTEERR